LIRELASGAKAQVSIAGSMYGLKPIPFNAGAKAQVSIAGSMYGLKPIPFDAGAKAHAHCREFAARLKSCPVTERSQKLPEAQNG